MRCASQREPKGSLPRGFTLLEIVVSLAVVGLILGVTISRMDTVMAWDLKRSSTKLASTIRYLYNKAATEGLYIRLVLDLDEQTYWVESTTDPVLLESGDGAREKANDKAQKKAKEKEAAAKAGEEAKKGEAATGKEEKAGAKPPGAPETIKEREPVFSPVESYLLKPTKLPDTVFFKDLQVEHRQFPVEGGKESIYFFPNGFVEHAVINLRDEKDETHYSLETNPVSGRVSIEDRYRTIGGE